MCRWSVERLDELFLAHHIDPGTMQAMRPPLTPAQQAEVQAMAARLQVAIVKRRLRGTGMSVVRRGEA